MGNAHKLEQADKTALLTIEATLRATAKRVETYRIARDTDSEELDSIFETLLEQADQVRMIAQPILVRRNS